MMGMMGPCATSMGLFGSLLVLGLFTAGSAAALLLARRAPAVPQLAGWPPPGDDPALATLRERFARGEIDRAEFEERRRALTAIEPNWI